MAALGAGAVEFANFPDPNTYAASLVSPDRDLWAAACEDKLAALRDNGTGAVVKKVKGMFLLITHVLATNESTRNERNGDGTIGGFNARLVAGVMVKWLEYNTC
ncbi:hypothetical protein PsorP6_015802 [Peronosclerospora sorghi]|uniref:Uncharacterized protein n=1 Tax=Peronosclerospora sorghi TaxID=230839 RepID=A0ACC0WNZ8_9STRA|nr:hypothetical protein PsorP6_015802 [Peronosclerospora sorghi]